MASKKISQKDARFFRAELQTLQRQRADERRAWVREYPGGVLLGSITGARGVLDGRIEAARMLGHPVVVVPDNNGKMHFYAVK